MRKTKPASGHPSRDAERTRAAILEAATEEFARHGLGGARVDSISASAGGREGVFRTGVDPLQLYISIAALCYFYLSNIHTLSSIFGRDLATAPARSARLKHMTDVVLGYLRREAVS